MAVYSWAASTRSSNRRRRTAVVAVVLMGSALIGSSRSEGKEPAVRAVQPDDATRTAAAVVVPEGTNLVHTAQFLPLDEQGSIIGPERANEQAKVVLDRIEAALKGAGSGLDKLVKVNVYAARLDVLPAFRTALAERLADSPARPVLSLVVGGLAHPEALLAADAVAVTSESNRRLTAPTSGQRSGAPVAILPAGARVYISGQAEPHADLAEATRRTLKSLEHSLAYLGLDKSHVIQLKAFMQPISAAAVVEREMTAFFGAGAVPPLAYVEWRSGATMPIEIELIARAGARTEPAPLEVLTPTGMKPSPVFSRVARVNRGDLVYIGGLFGPPQTNGTVQVQVIFATLWSILDETKSDFHRLAKATYYVSDDEASRALNDLRPKYYDPKIPPAASKAVTPGVGAEGRTVTVDMIGVASPVPADADAKSSK